MADPMRIRAANKDGVVEVRVLMSHPMESGIRKDAAGNLVAAHYIQNLEATHNGKAVLKAQFSGAVSQNPFLSFKFKGGNKGEKVSVKWTDNKGDSRTDEATIA
jgi:sulfur-oxidizing protein SoxZ